MLNEFTVVEKIISLGARQNTWFDTRYISSFVRTRTSGGSAQSSRG
jgi:hypothetical protein